MTHYVPELAAVLSREPEWPGGVETRTVEYDADGTGCVGYFAAPAGPGPYPGVLVVHDWLGLGDHPRMRAEMLARLGYAAFAADIYGGGLEPSPADAPQVAGRFYGDQALWRARLTASLAAMVAEPMVDRTSTAAIGYCFGGSAVLQLARTGADLRGVVSFHGGLQPGPQGEAAGITASLLVLAGGADPVAPPSAVAAYAEDLRSAPELDWQIHVYSGAMHAFAVPTASSPEHGAAFDPVAERRSWNAMKSFLAEVFA